MVLGRERYGIAGQECAVWLSSCASAGSVSYAFQPFHDSPHPLLPPAVGQGGGAVTVGERLVVGYVGEYVLYLRGGVEGVEGYYGVVAQQAGQLARGAPHDDHAREHGLPVALGEGLDAARHLGLGVAAGQAERDAGVAHGGEELLVGVDETPALPGADMIDGGRQRGVEHAPVAPSELQEVYRSPGERPALLIQGGVHALGDAEDIHVGKPLAHPRGRLRGGEYGRAHVVPLHPSAHLPEVARPAVPHHGHYLVERVVGEGVEAHRHRLHEPQPRLAGRPREPRGGLAQPCGQRGKAEAVGRGVRPARRVVGGDGASAQPCPCLVGGALEVDAPGMEIWGDGGEGLCCVWHQSVSLSSSICRYVSIS